MSNSYHWNNNFQISDFISYQLPMYNINFIVKQLLIELQKKTKHNMDKTKKNEAI